MASVGSIHTYKSSLKFLLPEYSSRFRLAVMGGDMAPSLEETEKNLADQIFD